MQQVMGDATQNKLILLFVFDKMEVPLSENTIIDMCCSTNTWIAYMDCKQILASLIESGFIFTTENPHRETLYTITPQGRVCLAQFFTRIPSSLREAIDVFVKENRVRYRRRQECFADYFKNADGSYTVALRIVEPTQPIFDLKLNVPNRQTAKTIYKQWQDKAAQAYMLLYDLLAE